MNKNSIYLIIILLMFPQVVETLYSPALPNIAAHFQISISNAAQTLSVYFIAFAFGVVFWGRLCDLYARKPMLLLGLAIYGLGATLSLITHSFELLLIGRALSAFGAAVGSIVTQTMLRDSYSGVELNRIFSIMGAGIALSPIVGLILGGLLVDRLGHQGLFSFLVLISIVLWLMSRYLLIETKPNNLTPIPLWPLATRMFNDGKIWRCAILTASFNLMLFGYYALAPFIFSELGQSALVFGYSGIVLAFGTLLGSLLNKKLLMLGWQEKGLTLMASCLAMVGAIGVATLQTSLAFLIPMIAVVISFGIAIPNILSSALDDYKAMVGSAGALLGLTYYLILGLSLLLASLIHDLGLVLLAASTVSLIVSIVQIRKAANFVDHTI